MVWYEQAPAEGPGSGGQGPRPALDPLPSPCPRQDEKGGRENKVWMQGGDSIRDPNFKYRVMRFRALYFAFSDPGFYSFIQLIKI